MSKTLFWYILRDLLKIFLMTSGVLAGIFSFAGLLKPLIQVGLSGPQMVQMLGYLMPAMQTFTLPIAALFATTMVYGRLAADNELTACRATGISFGVLATPALVLGLTLSLVSLLSMSFVVPRYMLKAEKVMFASLAEAIKKNIEREHKIKLPDHTIYAERAEILPSPGPGEELIILYSPIFCSLDTAPSAGMIDADGRVPRGTPRIPVPSEFFTARTATVRIHQAGEGKDARVEISAVLDGGVMFPRKLEGQAIGGVREGQFGPIAMDSPIRQNTMFMTVQQLHRLLDHPLESREVRGLFSSLNRQEQEQKFAHDIEETLLRRREFVFAGSQEQTYRLRLDRGARRTARGTGKVTFGSAAGRDVRLERINAGEVMGTDDARLVTVKVQSDPENQRMRVEFVLEDVQVGLGEGTTNRPSFARYHAVPMSPDVLEIMNRDPDSYSKKHDAEGARFRQKYSVLRSGIWAELHWRVSFAVSCVILVMIGCTLGMMFRAGNFLSAFALSVVPALFCIVLMITGKHISEQDAKNLKLGLSLIWSGNAVVLGLAVTLLARLHRQ